MSAETLWTAQEAAAATGGRLNGNRDWQATGASIDSRTLQKGDLFIALHGANDGHDYVDAALEKGAIAAMVDRVPPHVGADKPLLGVDDTQKALEALGKAGRARSQARFVAVTGSVGKTSTKEALRHVLSAQAPTSASVASYNNHIGVPLTLARVPRSARYAVIEIGMNHPGEIAPLARMARLDVAMITTVAPAHLFSFDGIEGIAREKAAILDGLLPGGTAVLPADLDVSPILTARAREIGLVNEILPDQAGLMARAQAMAQEIAANSPLAVQESKQVLGFASRREVEASLDYVALWNAAFLHSEDLGEALAAFTQRRKPEFRGQ